MHGAAACQPVWSMLVHRKLNTKEPPGIHPLLRFPGAPTLITTEQRGNKRPHREGREGGRGRGRELKAEGGEVRWCDMYEKRQ